MSVYSKSGKEQGTGLYASMKCNTSINYCDKIMLSWMSVNCSASYSVACSHLQLIHNIEKNLFTDSSIIYPQVR